MKILIILDPLASIKTSKDTTYTMMCAAQARGHELLVCQMGDLLYDSVAGGAVIAKASGLRIDEAGSPWYHLDDARDIRLADADAVLMRTDPPFDMEYVYATYMLDRAEAQGARVFNRGRAIRRPQREVRDSRIPRADGADHHHP